MRSLLTGLAWALAALVFGAAGAILIVAATVLGLAFDWALTGVFWCLVGLCKGARWLLWRKG